MYKVTALPHPSPLVPSRPKSLQPYPVALVRSCAALCGLPFLSLHYVTQTQAQTQRKRKGTDGRRPNAKGTHSTAKGTHSVTKGTQGRNEGNGNAQRNAQPRAGRKPGRQGEKGGNGTPSFLSFPLPLSFLFRPFRIPARTKGKNIFVSKKPFLASFTRFYFRSYKLEKINL